MKRRLSYLIDETAGLLARAQHWRSPNHPNTREELRLYFGKNMGAFFPAPRAVPNVRLQRRWNRGRLECDDLTFESLHEPICPKFRSRHESDYEANHTVHVRWIRHRAGTLRPTVIYLHPWMYPETFLDEFVFMPRLAKALDVDIASMQLPYHGKRKPAHSIYHGELFWTSDMVRSIEAVRQSVHDVRTLIHWFTETQHIAAGMIGVSLGGIVTLATVCVEPRLAFAIPMGAHMDFPAVLEEASLLKLLRLELARQGWNDSDFESYIRAIGFSDLKPCIPKERILLVAGMYDRFLTPERITDLWRHWDYPPIHMFQGGHVGLVANMRTTIRAVKEFLHNIEPARTMAG